MSTERVDIDKIAEFRTTREALEAETDYASDSDDVVYDNLDEFQMAVARAVGDGNEYIVVSPRLMRFLSRDEKTKSITYGKPGVRVYKAGSKEELDAEDAMGVDEYHKRQMQKAREKFLEDEAKKKKRKL